MLGRFTDAGCLATCGRRGHKRGALQDGIGRGRGWKGFSFLKGKPSEAGGGKVPWGAMKGYLSLF